MPPAASTRSGLNEAIFSTLGLAKSPILGRLLAATEGPKHEREPRLGRETRLQLLHVAVAVKADDAAADAADEGVAVSDRRRGVTDLAASVLHPGQQAEVRQKGD